MLKYMQALNYKIKVEEMKIFKYEITDSTNQRAREYAREVGGAEPVLFIANGQTAGRGRKGRSFDSEMGKGLYTSLLFSPDGPFDAALLTVRAAVATARAIYRTAGFSVGIKWVNDIFSRGKKMAGILAEGEFSSDGNLSYAIIGVGVNLLSRKFPHPLCDIATTLEDECGKKVSAEELAKAFAEEFFALSDKDEIMREYRNLSTVIGKNVTVRSLDGEEFLAYVIDVTDTGALFVRCEDGSTRELISAEVSIKNI